MPVYPSNGKVSKQDWIAFLDIFFMQGGSVIFVCLFYGAIQDNFGALTVPHIKRGWEKLKFQVLKLCMIISCWFILLVLGTM